MMKWRGFAPLILIAFLGLFWLFFGSEKGANWLAQVIAPDLSASLPAARVVSLNGQMKIISHGSVTAYSSENKPPMPLEMRDGDRLEVDEGSRTVVVLNSQDEFEIKDLSSVMFQLWNPKDQSSPVYMNWLQGTVILLKPGIKGRAYVMKEGRLYLPGQKPSQQPLALTVLRSAPLDMELLKGDELDPQDEEALDVETPEEVADAPTGATPETLSNEYIDETVSTKQGQLQKCWLSRLKDKPGLKGQLTMQFEITRRGLVKDVRVYNSTINDDALNKCVIAVFQRIQFRRFKGSEISLTFPLSFE